MFHPPAYSPPDRPIPTRVVVFIDGQNLYHRCKDHFGHPWVHPMELAKALVQQDVTRYGAHSHVLGGVHYYTGIHDPNRRPTEHGEMARRLAAYKLDGVVPHPIQVRYDGNGRAREKGVDVRLGLDAVRLGRKGLYDVAIIVSEDSDLNEAVEDIYELRDPERWIAVENALPSTPNSHTRWLSSARRKRLIDQALFNLVADRTVY